MMKPNILDKFLFHMENLFNASLSISCFKDINSEGNYFKCINLLFVRGGKKE